MNKLPMWLLLLLGGGVLYMVWKKKSVMTEAGQGALDNAAALAVALPSEAQPYADVIRQVASERGVDPLLIAAIGQQESRWGQALSPRGPGGTGSGGHDRGLMQISDQTWGDWLAANDWTDPYTNVSKGAEILASNLSYFGGKGFEGDDLTHAALAAYNGGPGRVWAAIQNGASPDSVTTGGNYGASVMNYFSQYVASASSALGLDTGAA